MSGDCGHGWGYHSKGPSGPCDKCTEERKKSSYKAKYLELRTLCEAAVRSESFEDLCSIESFLKENP